MPTLLEIAGTEYPDVIDGEQAPPLIGKSWIPLLSGQAESPRTADDWMAWELFGNRALRQGTWKLRWQWEPYGNGEWQLFDLASDSGERNDLSQERPEKLEELLGLWNRYATENNVILPSRSPYENLEQTLPTRFPVEAGFPPLIYKRQFVPPPDMRAEPKG